MEVLVLSVDYNYDDARSSGNSGEFTEEAGECRKLAGEDRRYTRYAAIVPLSAFEYDDRFKDMCGECPYHGKNYSCPPHSPSFAAHVGANRRAEVVCIKMSKANFCGDTPQDIYHACFREAGRLLRLELDRHRTQGEVIAGSGPCLACEHCALVAGGSACNRPELRVYSLESLGVNVVGLLKKVFDIELEWDSVDEKARTVCAIGAAFFA
jgi:predicted metal-binding protein